MIGKVNDYMAMLVYIAYMLLQLAFMDGPKGGWFEPPYNNLKTPSPGSKHNLIYNVSRSPMLSVGKRRTLPISFSLYLDYSYDSLLLHGDNNIGKGITRTREIMPQP